MDIPGVLTTAVLTKVDLVTSATYPMSSRSPKRDGDGRRNSGRRYGRG